MTLPTGLVRDSTPSRGCRKGSATCWVCADACAGEGHGGAGGQVLVGKRRGRSHARVFTQVNKLA